MDNLDLFDDLELEKYDDSAASACKPFSSFLFIIQLHPVFKRYHLVFYMGYYVQDGALLLT
jgi:hypothetical protein